MAYRELPPSPALAPWVRCVWVFESAAGGAPERIVPDGRPELVVHFGAPYAEVDRRGERMQPRALLAGQLTRPLRLRATGPAGVLGVRFHPDGARGLAAGGMRAATDRRVAIDAALAEAVLYAASEGERIAIVERFVAQRVQPPDAVVRSCVEAIERGAQPPAAGIGRRQLERRFADAVGVGPARLAAIFRFRRVFDVLERDTARPWTDAALAAGFYDQSHLIREFRRYVGCTPSEFQREAAGLAAALVAA